LQASGHVIDRHDNFFGLITLEYEDKLDRHLLERAMWSVACKTFNDNKIQNKVYQAISRSYWPALDDILDDLVLQEELRGLPSEDKELEYVEAFARKWIEQAMSRAWSALDKVQSILTRDLASNLFQSLIAPFGGENPFSCIPGALTERIGRPPPDWAFITKAVTELFDGWGIEEKIAVVDCAASGSSASRPKQTQGVRYTGYRGPKPEVRPTSEQRPNAKKPVAAPVSLPVRLKVRPELSLGKVRPQGPAAREKLASKAPKGTLKASIQNREVRKKIAPVQKKVEQKKVAARPKSQPHVKEKQVRESDHPPKRQLIAEACSKRYQRLLGNKCKPNSAYVKTKLQPDEMQEVEGEQEEEQDELLEEAKEEEQEEAEEEAQEEDQEEEHAGELAEEQGQQEEQAEEQEGEQEGEQGEEEDVQQYESEGEQTPLIDVDEEDMQAAWEEGIEATEEVGPRHPRCTSEEDCVGSPDCQLIQHYHKGKKADIYCSKCWDSFTKQHTSLMGRLLEE